VTIHEPRSGLTFETSLKAVITALVRVKGDQAAAVNLTADTALWSLDADDAASLDLDSLDLLEVVFELEDSLGVSLNDDVDLALLPTVGELARALTRADVDA
jgi:hypothetical protein